MKGINKQGSNSGNFSYLTRILIPYTMRIIVFLIAFVVGKQLLKEDFTPFITWWLTLLAITVTFYPLIGILFKNFHDSGWIFSKAIGIAIAGWVLWYLSSLRLLKFTRQNAIITLLICFVVNLLIVGFAYYLRNRGEEKKCHFNDWYQFDVDKAKSILTIEIIFFVMFLFWCYARGFKPEAYGTEKMMDYGFMTSMMRTEYMPPLDTWFSGEPINYYYLGQYLGTYLSKLSGVGVEFGYNLMLMTLAGIAFTQCYSIMYNVMKTFLQDSTLRRRQTAGDHFVLSKSKRKGLWCTLSGLISGFSVVFAGNMHYPIYKHIKPWIEKISGKEVSSYWFPSSTRYIGYDPVIETDQTIHEFPSYSFILGDLHAHVINIIFVLAVLGLLFAWLLYRKQKMDDLRYGITIQKPNFLQEAFHPIILLIGFFIGLFHMTNFWDFPIYFVVSGAVILFSNLVIYQFSRVAVLLTGAQAVIILLVSSVVCKPFTESFNQIATSIYLTEARSMFHQMLVLWGLPFVVCGYFVISRYCDLKKEGFITNKKASYKKLKLEQKEEKRVDYNNFEGNRLQKLMMSYETTVTYGGEKNKLYQWIESLQIADLFVVIMALCAMGLIIIPEVIYVKDIYPNHKRANTMFKLTYQGFIMFGLCFGFILVRFLRFGRTIPRKIVAAIGLLLLLWTTGYSVTAMNSWFGDIRKPQNYEGLDASAFMEKENSDDFLATNWLNENITGQPVVLEANGDSYTFYERVSVITGLPTILGWRTHEWLWRSGADIGLPPEVAEREKVVELIYTSMDENEIKDKLREYHVEYIYVGKLEAEKFGTENHELLKTLGDVVFSIDARSGKDYETFIVRVNLD